MNFLIAGLTPIFPAVFPSVLPAVFPVVFLGLILGLVGTVIFERGLKLVHKHVKENPTVMIRGYHIHHSIIGVLLYCVYMFEHVPILLGIGTGIIVQHTILHKGHFVIVNKEK